MSATNDKPRRGIQSIEVGMRLLLALGQNGRPMALKDLSKAAHMPTGQAHPYLVSFAKVGFVVQDPITSRYWLGPTAIQLGLVSLNMLNPVREATADSERLAESTGHSVALTAWGNRGPTVVRLIDSIYPLHVNMRTGTIMSMVGTATGRLFAAYMPRKLIEALLVEDYRRLGPDISTALNSEDVEKQLQEIRKYGLSRAVGNPNPGINAFAAPVFDYSGNIVLSITLMGSSGIFDPSWNGELATALKKCANEISMRMGYTPA